MKAGIAAFSAVCAQELDRYGVRSNAIAPAARTRLTADVPGVAEIMKTPVDGGFDWYAAANVSPMIAYLATADCALTGETFFVGGDNVSRFLPFKLADTVLSDGHRWTVDKLAAHAAEIIATPWPDEKDQRVRLRPRVISGVSGGNDSDGARQ